jgi:hypothetical protein
MLPNSSEFLNMNPRRNPLPRNAVEDPAAEWWKREGIHALSSDAP